MHDTGLSFIFFEVSALVMLGLLRWQVTIESIWRCVAETVAVGGICAVIAYAVGMIVGGLG